MWVLAFEQLEILHDPNVITLSARSNDDYIGKKRRRRVAARRRQEGRNADGAKKRAVGEERLFRAKTENCKLMIIDGTEFVIRNDANSRQFTIYGAAERPLIKSIIINYVTVGEHLFNFII